jgi:hypothetical protein
MAPKGADGRRPASGGVVRGVRLEKGKREVGNASLPHEGA